MRIFTDCYNDIFPKEGFPFDDIVDYIENYFEINE